MERIVWRFANINFEQNTCEEILAHNRTSNFAAGTTTMSGVDYPASQVNAVSIHVGMDTNAVDAQKSWYQEITVPDTVNEYDEDEEEEEEEENIATTSGGASSVDAAQRRRMPSRASKESPLFKVKRRTILKPTKRMPMQKSSLSALSAAAIKKIYMNKSLTKFRPSNLETIFEEPEAEEALDSSLLRFIGAKKMRRSLSCSDGLNVNKTLMKKRRAKIKKIFGQRYAKKKISLNDFYERLNNSFDAIDDVGDNEQLLVEINNVPEQHQMTLVQSEIG